MTTAPYLPPDHPGAGRRRARPSPSRSCSATASSQWRLQPADGTADGTFAPTNTRPAAPDAVGGDLQVGAFNVLNYFLTLTGPDARGAQSPARARGAGGQDRPGHQRARRRRRHPAWRSRTPTPPATRPGTPTRALADLVRRLDAAAGCAEVGLRAAARRAVRRRPRRHPQRHPLPQRRGAAGRRPGRAGRRGGLVQRPRADRADVREGRRRVHRGRQPLQVQERGRQHRGQRGRRRRPGPVERRPRPPGRVARDLRRGAARAPPATTTSLLLGDFNAYTQEDPIERLRAAGFTDLGEALDAGPLQLRVRRPVRLARPRAGHAGPDRQGHRPHALEHQRGRVLRLPVHRRPGPVRGGPVPVQRPRPARARRSTSPSAAPAWCRRSSAPPGDDVLRAPRSATSSWASAATTS